MPILRAQCGSQLLKDCSPVPERVALMYPREGMSSQRCKDLPKVTRVCSKKEKLDISSVVPFREGTWLFQSRQLSAGQLLMNTDVKIHPDANWRAGLVHLTKTILCGCNFMWLLLLNLSICVSQMPPVFPSFLLLLLLLNHV